MDCTACGTTTPGDVMVSPPGIPTLPSPLGLCIDGNDDGDDTGNDDGDDTGNEDVEDVKYPLL